MTGPFGEYARTFNAIYIVILICLHMLFFKQFFQEHYQSIKWFGSRSGMTECLGSNCLQSLSLTPVESSASVDADKIAEGVKQAPNKPNNDQ